MAFFETYASLKEAEEALSGRTGACRVVEDGTAYSLCRVAAGLIIRSDTGKMSFTLTEKLPADVLKEAVGYFRTQLPNEAAGRIYRDSEGGWFFHPTRSLEADRVHVRYEDSDQPEAARQGKAMLIAEIHSHDSMPAFFSAQDRASAVYPGLYICAGNIDRDEFSVACCAEMDFTILDLDPAEIFEDIKRAMTGRWHNSIYLSSALMI